MHLCCTYIDMQNTALVLVRKSERQAQYVFEGECKSSDTECSAAPKMRFCENTEPHLFCCFRKVPEGSRTARPAALRPGRGEQSGGLSARARESPFRRTKMRFCGNARPHLFFVAFIRRWWTKRVAE